MLKMVLICRLTIFLLVINMSLLTANPESDLDAKVGSEEGENDPASNKVAMPETHANDNDDCTTSASTCADVENVSADEAELEPTFMHFITTIHNNCLSCQTFERWLSEKIVSFASKIWFYVFLARVAAAS